MPCKTYHTAFFLVFVRSHKSLEINSFLWNKHMNGFGSLHVIKEGFICKLEDVNVYSTNALCVIFVIHVK